MVTQGPVRRHAFRGDVAIDTKTQKELEDEQIMPGMRDPALLRQSWPELWSTMTVVRETLLAARAQTAELRGLADALGNKATRQPPPREQTIAAVRAQVSQALGLTMAAGDATHCHSPWRFGFVREIQQRCHDPDVALPEWLENGAPMGIRKPIEVGGLFPPFQSPASMPPDAVLALKPVPNHQSFKDLQSCARPPATT